MFQSLLAAADSSGERERVEDMVLLWCRQLRAGGSSGARGAYQVISGQLTGDAFLWNRCTFWPCALRDSATLSVPRHMPLRSSCRPTSRPAPPRRQDVKRRRHFLGSGCSLSGLGTPGRRSLQYILYLLSTAFWHLSRRYHVCLPDPRHKPVTNQEGLRFSWHRLVYLPGAEGLAWTL